MPDWYKTAAEVEAEELQATYHRIRTRSWTEETRGITVADRPVQTDRESQALINGLWNMAKDKEGQGDLSWTTDFQFADGTFAAVDIAGAKAIGRAVADHIQTCFARRRQLFELVAAGTFIDADLDLGWP